MYIEIYIVIKESVVDGEKDVSLFFRRDESRCCASDSPVSSKNKDTPFSPSTTNPHAIGIRNKL